MTLRRRGRLWLAPAIGLVAVLALGGCSTHPSPSGPQAKFDATVAKADAAMKAGDAETALELYTDALAIGRLDKSGAVAKRQGNAKHLVLSRRILATTEPSVDSLDRYVQVLQYASADSTEAAAARNGLAQSLDQMLRPMGGDVAAIRAAISANKSVRLPPAPSLVLGMSAGWRSSVAEAPGPIGRHAVAAVDGLDSAAAKIKAAFGTTDERAALGDLTAADRMLATATSELQAVRQGK